MRRADERWSRMLPVRCKSAMGPERRARCVFLRTFDPSVGEAAVPVARARLRAGQWLHVFAAVVAPAECRLCGLPLVTTGRFPVCGECLQQVGRPVVAGCFRCGAALEMESARAAGLGRADAAVCADCMDEPPPFTRARAFGEYGGELRALIHLQKFDGIRALRVPLARLLAVAMEEACEGVAGTVHVVAVPLYAGRRGFNQSTDLADDAVKLLPGVPIVCAHGLLRRTRRTESQSHLSLQQRRDNVRGAFAVRGDVRGLTVLLVDDVYTTGATVTECTRVLLRAGAAEVRVATLARVQRTGWDQGVVGWDGLAL